MAPNFVSFLANKFQILSAITSSAGVGDADKIVATGSGGKISMTFLLAPASDPTGITGADAITNMVSLTQAEYDAIGSPNATTLYYITT